MEDISPESADFDAFADNYSVALRAGLSITGQTQEYFARERIRLLAKRVERSGRKIERVLDFGCGQGSSTPLLRSELGARFAVGADVSEGLLAIARKTKTDPNVSYMTISDIPANEPFDCVYMNGVLHHIRPEDRLGAIRKVFDALVPGGLFALWENNPWNPGTRYVMSRIPFDRDAIMLSIPQSQALLKEGGFDPVSTDSLFFFPRVLSPLRALERFLSPTMLGGQYLILSERK